MFRKLKGKIKEVYDTQKKFSNAMEMTPSALNQRLMGTTEWKTQEIAKACDLLDIPLSEAYLYFFN